MTDRLQQLSEAGVSIWLDDLSRERLETGNLADLVKHSHVVGVTTNPTMLRVFTSSIRSSRNGTKKLIETNINASRMVPFVAAILKYDLMTMRQLLCALMLCVPEE